MSWQREVDLVLERFEFTAPVELEDVREVKRAIEDALGVRAEVYHRHSEVTVRVRHEGADYKRTMKVTA